LMSQEKNVGAAGSRWRHRIGGPFTLEIPMTKFPNPK
jgi:hypothetical protein